MDNPYAGPRSAPARQSRRWERLLRWRFFVYSLFLYPIWFFVGFALSIGGSEAEMAADAALFLFTVGASIVTFLYGVLGTIRGGARS